MDRDGADSFGATTGWVSGFVFRRFAVAGSGFLKIIEPENAATLAQLESAVRDVKTLIAARNPAALASVLDDASGLIKSAECRFFATGDADE